MSSLDQPNDDLLPTRLNVEPTILAGLSFSELINVAIGSFIVSFVFCLVVGLLVGQVIICLGASVVLTVIMTYGSARAMAPFKRDKPDGYFAHKMALWAERYLSKRSGFIRYEGKWDNCTHE